MLCLSSGLHPSEEHFKANYITTLCEGSSRCFFFSLFLEASHIPRFFVRMKKEKKREKMATLCGVDRHFCGPWRHDVRVKHLVTQPGNAPKARPSHLTTADQVNKVSEGLAFKDHKVLRRMQTLNWDTANLAWANGSRPDVRPLTSSALCAELHMLSTEKMAAGKKVHELKRTLQTVNLCAVRAANSGRLS